MRLKRIVLPSGKTEFYVNGRRVPGWLYRLLDWVTEP